MKPNMLDAHLSRPPLVISNADYDLIANLALSIEGRLPTLARQLLEEIDRAEIVPAIDLPPDVVALGSEVEFEDESSGARRTVRLVTPGEADIEQGRISILTSVGAGLIGMAAGAEISWPRPDGTQRRLRIVHVNRVPLDEPGSSAGGPLPPRTRVVGSKAQSDTRGKPQHANVKADSDSKRER